MRALLALSNGVDAVVNFIGKLASWLFIPLMLVIFYDISQRKILEWNSDFIDSMFYLSSTKLQELEWHLHAALFLLCLGFAYLRDAHVRIELVRDRMGPRSRVWLELIGCLAFLIPYSILIIRYGGTFAERSFDTNEISAAQTGLSHRWIIKAAMPVGFTVLLAAGLSVVIKCLIYLFGPTALKPQVSYWAGTHHADLPDDVAERGPITD